MNPYKKLIKNAELFMSLKCDESDAENRKKIICSYLAEGGDVDAADNLDNDNTLLHWAVQSAQQDLVNSLLANNADVTIKNRFGKTALDLARSLPKKTNNKNIVASLVNLANLHPRVLNEASSSSGNTKGLLKYKKKGGTAGVRGQLYETKLSSLTLHRALTDNDVTKFYLGTNVDGVGELDDVCLRFELKNDSTHKMIFIQAKHRDYHDKNPIKLADLKNTSSDFSLVKYFDSYMKIKNMVKKDNQDRMFNGEIEKIDFVLVLYTPSKNSIPNEYKTFNAISHQIKKVIHVKDGAGDIFKISDLNLAVESIVSKRIQALGELLKQAILKDNANQYSNLMIHELIKRYHVILAKKVIIVLDVKTQEVGKSIETYREGKFRADFFTTTNHLLQVLRTKIFEGISADTIEKYKAESFKLPNTFGNIDLHVQKPKRIKSLGDDFITLFHKTTDTNKVKIDNSIFQTEVEENIMKPITNGFVKLGGGIAGLVGNLLIFDDETKMLKFSPINNLSEGNAKYLLKYLLGQVDEDTLYTYRFDINIEDFPTLFLDGDEKDRQLVREFLDNLWFCTNQPMESDIESELKKEIEDKYLLEKKRYLFRIQTEAIFLKFHDAIQKWWIDQKNSFYLTKDCDFLEKSKSIIVSSPMLTVLDFVFMNKIKKNEFKFTEDAIQNLGLQDFMKRQPDHVLNISTDQSFLSIIKLAQCFEDHFKTNITFLNLEFIIDEDYYDIVINEIKDATLTATIEVLVFIYNRQADIHKLCNLIEIVRSDSKIILIVVSEKNITSEIESHCSKKCIHKKDERNCLADITNIDKLSKSWTVIFQGQETKFDQVIDKASRDLIHSEILWKFINNEKIKIGKPIVNSTHNEVKEYYIPRKLKGDGDMSINTFKDINEHVVIVAAEPGMGKSTLLTQLAINTKELNQNESQPSPWIVYINLLDYSGEFNEWQTEETSIDTNEVINFICKVSINEFNLKMISSEGSTAAGSSSNLKGNKSKLNAFKIEMHGKKIDLKSFVNSKKILFELQLFLNYYRKGKVIFLLDGFDEICPHYEKEVLNLLKELTMSHHAPNCELLKPSQESVTCKCQRLGRHQQRLWVTTRSYNNVKNALENILGRPAYGLKPLSTYEQALYLKKYMATNFRLPALNQEEIINISEFFDYMLHILSDKDRHIKMVNVPIYTVYVVAVEYFQNNLSNYVSINAMDMANLQQKCDDAALFLAGFKSSFEKEEDINYMMTISENPLCLYIAAEYFRTQIKGCDSKFLDKAKTNSKWDVNIKSFSLFEHFLDIKFKKIRFNEKNKVNLNIPDNDMTYQKERKDFIEKHKRIALCALFEDKDLIKSMIITEAELKNTRYIIDRIASGEEKTGVVESVINNKPRFVHSVFAEYFAVEYICDKLIQAFTSDIQGDEIRKHQLAIWRFIMNIVLYKSAGGVRTFFDHKLSDKSEDCKFLNAIRCDESKKIVYEALLKQLDWSIKTSLNIVLVECLHNTQTYFLDCIKHNLNVTNKDAFTRIVNDNSVMEFLMQDSLIASIIPSLILSSLYESPFGMDASLGMMSVPSLLKMGQLLSTFASNDVFNRNDPQSLFLRPDINEKLKSTWNTLTSGEFWRSLFY